MAEDPTVERLLYEDYKDRFRRKGNLSLSDGEFRQILAALAENYRAGVRNFRTYELREFVAHVDEAGAAIEEIVEGGLLVATGLPSAPFRVEPRRLIHGLGMLLADHLSEAPNASIQEHLEKIHKWFEPQPDMEMKSPIAAAAIFFSTIAPFYPVAARRALLQYWIGRRNVPESEEEILTAYLPECAEDVFDIIDIFWVETEENRVALEKLAEAVTKRRDHPRVKSSLVKATKRWMSYVNIAGYPSQRGANNESKEKVIADISNRFGHEIHSGDNVQFDRWSFRVIEDDRTLGLCRFALEIISAGDRFSLAETFLAWAVSRELMGKVFEEEHVAWMLRLTNEPIWEALETDLSRMAATTNDVIRKAADLLLWCLGRPEANALRRDLLHDLHPKPGWLIEHEKDPCKGFFALRQNQYELCMSRKDIPIKSIIWKLGKYLPDPSLQAPAEFVSRLSDESRQLPLHAFRRHRMGKTAEEIEIDRLLDVAARFAPSIAGDVLRAIVHTLRERILEEQSFLLRYFPEITPVLQSEELTILGETLAEIRHAVAEDPANKNENYAEANGTLALLYHLLLADVPACVVNRPPETYDDEGFFSYVSSLPPDRVIALLNEILSEDNTTRILRILWMLSHSEPLLSDVHETKLLDFLFGNDAGLRHGAIRFAYFNSNSRLVKAILDEDTSFYDQNQSNASAYGAAILCNHAKEIPLATLGARLSLEDFVDAISIRGCLPEDIDVLATIIDFILGKTPNRPSLCADWFVGITQRGANSLWGCRLKHDVVCALCTRHPELTEKWLKPILLRPDSSAVRYAGFYQSLCEALLKVNPEIGFRLWQKLYYLQRTSFVFSGIEWLTIMVFAALPSPYADRACSQLLSSANTDLDLQKLVTAASNHGQNTWILNSAQSLLNTPHLWQRGKGLMMIALSDHEKKFQEFEKDADMKDTWLEGTSPSMRYIYTRKEWGKHWYRQFLTATDEDVAYSGWLLLLKCIDSRSRKWMHALEEEIFSPGTLSERRVRFRMANKSEIKSAIEQNERDYKDHFLTIKMSSFHQVIPFTT